MWRATLPPVELAVPASWSLRFHFPASLGSTGVTPPPRYYGCSDSLPSGSSGLSGHERRSVPGRSRCLPRLRLLPFCLQPPSGDAAAFGRFTVSFGARTWSRWPAPPPARLLPSGEAWAAGRTALSGRRLVPRSGRIKFTVFRQCTESMLQTGSSPPAAPRLVLPRRNSLRSQASESSA